MNALIYFVAIGSAAVGGVMLTVFGATLLRSSQPFRSILASLAPSARTRWAVAVVMTADLAVVALAVLPSLVITMWIWSEKVDWVAPIVMLPVLTVVVTLAVLAVSLARDPHIASAPR